MTRSPWSTDLTVLCERLARRLRSEGALHPESGAVALAVRGHLGRDRADLAVQLGIADAQLAAVETGECPWSAVPGPIKQTARALQPLDLVALGLG